MEPKTDAKPHPAEGLGTCQDIENSPLDHVRRPDPELSVIGPTFLGGGSGCNVFNVTLERPGSPDTELFFFENRGVDGQQEGERALIAFGSGPYDEAMQKAHREATVQMKATMSGSGVAEAVYCRLPESLAITEGRIYGREGILPHPRDFDSGCQTNFDDFHHEYNQEPTLQVEHWQAMVSDGVGLICVVDELSPDAKSKALIFDLGDGRCVVLSSGSLELSEDIWEPFAKDFFPNVQRVLLRAVGEGVVITTAEDTVWHRKNEVFGSKPLLLPVLSSAQRDEEGVRLQFKWPGGDFAVQGTLELGNNQYVFRAQGPALADAASEVVLRRIVDEALSVYWRELGEVSVDYKGEGSTIALAPVVESIKYIGENIYRAQVSSGSGQELDFYFTLKGTKISLVVGETYGLLPGYEAQDILTTAFKAKYPDQPIDRGDFRGYTPRPRFSTARE